MTTTGMTAIVVGSGSAVPDPERGNPSIAVVVDEEVLVFDCGERATVNLVRAGINPLDVNHLFFSHLLWDHIADYNYLVISTWNCGKSRPLQVYGPPGTKAMTDHMLGMHAVDVEFVRRFLDSLPAHIAARPLPDPPIVDTEIGEGRVLETSSVTVSAREVEHINRLLDHRCFGFRVESAHGSVAISGDTEPCGAMIELARDVDVLIHECTFLEEVMAQREMHGHSGPRGAGRVAREAGARKLVLTHLGPYDSLSQRLTWRRCTTGHAEAPRYGPRFFAMR